MIQEERGSLTLESVFVFGLILMTLGGVILFSFTLHDRVLQTSAALSLGMRLRRAGSPGAGEDTDFALIRADFSTETAGHYLILKPGSLNTENASGAVLVRTGASSEIGGNSAFSWLRHAGSSDCQIVLRNFTDPVQRLLVSRADPGKEGND